MNIYKLEDLNYFYTFKDYFINESLDIFRSGLFLLIFFYIDNFKEFFIFIPFYFMYIYIMYKLDKKIFFALKK